MNQIFNTKTAKFLNECQHKNRYEYISILNEIYNFHIDRIWDPDKKRNDIRFSTQKHNSSDISYVMDTIFGKENYSLTPNQNEIVVTIKN